MMRSTALNRIITDSCKKLTIFRTPIRTSQNWLKPWVIHVYLRRKWLKVRVIIFLVMLQFLCQPPTSSTFCPSSLAMTSPGTHHGNKQGKRVRFTEVPRQTVRPVSVTVVGSSIVRGVAPLLKQSKEYSVDGFVFPGRTAKQINSTLKSIPKSDITVVSTGSNNIEGQPSKDCVDEVRQVVDNISRKWHNRTVIMCQIPHRFDKPHLNQKIDNVNSRIAKKSRDITTYIYWNIVLLRTIS